MSDVVFSNSCLTVLQHTLLFLTHGGSLSQIQLMPGYCRQQEQLQSPLGSGVKEEMATPGGKCEFTCNETVPKVAYGDFLLFIFSVLFLA